MKEDLLIITGTPRSCTTAFAAFCKMMGLDLNGKWCPELWSGGLEDPDSIKINNDINKSKDVSENIRGFQRNILKDPRFISNGNLEFIRTWKKYKPNLKLLIFQRDFLQVARSMVKTKRMTSLCSTPEKSAKLLEKRYNDFIKEIEILKIPYKTLTHPDFISDSKKTINLLTDFYNLNLQLDSDAISSYGVSGNSPIDIWNEWFNQNKVRKYKGYDNEPN